MLLPRHSVQWDTGDGFACFSFLLFVPKHIHWKSCFHLKMQEMVWEQRNTRDYSTSPPGPPHTGVQFLHRTKGHLGLLASPCSCCQAPWHGLCIQRLCLFRREDSSAPRGILFCFHLKAPYRQEHNPVQGHYKSDQPDLLLCPMHIPATCGSFHLVNKLKTEWR